MRESREILTAGPPDAARSVLLLPGGAMAARSFNLVMAEPAVSPLRLIATTLGRAGASRFRRCHVLHLPLDYAQACGFGKAAAAGPSVGASASRFRRGRTPSGPPKASLVGAVIGAVRPVRQTGHGAAWEALLAHEQPSTCSSSTTSRCEGAVALLLEASGQEPGAEAELRALVDSDVLPSGTTIITGDGPEQVVAQVLPDGRLYADGETYDGLVELSEVLGFEGNPWSLWSAELADGRVLLGVLRESQQEA